MARSPSESALRAVEIRVAEHEVAERHVGWELEGRRWRLVARTDRGLAQVRELLQQRLRLVGERAHRGRDRQRVVPRVDDAHDASEDAVNDEILRELGGGVGTR